MGVEERAAVKKEQKREGKCDKSVRVYFSDALWERLTAEERKTGVRKAGLIKIAVSAWLNSKDNSLVL